MVRSKRRKRANPSCVFCRRSHLVCDGERPCSRCVKREISHLCLKNDHGPATMQDISQNESSNFVSNSPLINEQDGNLDLTPIEESNLLSNTAPEPSDIANYEMQDINLGSSNLFNLLPTNQVFASQNVGSEFSSLNDFLNMLEEPSFLNNPEFQNTANEVNGNVNNSGNDTNDIPDQASRKTPGSSKTTRIEDNSNTDDIQHINSNIENARRASQRRNIDDSPNSSYNKNKATVDRRLGLNNTPKEHFFLTAADPVAEISPEEKLRLVINAKLEAGLLKPYDYAKGYIRLQIYMDRYMNQESKKRILQPLSIIRPAFRAIAKSLKDMDLILIEERFERMLLSYDRVFTSMSIPACLWRRTGEIYRGNKEFASLVECTVDQLREGNFAIYELMSEESAVNFWEKYGAIAFDKGQKAVLTSCNLRTVDSRKTRSCCFSFTIRRDMYNIPICIIGNFIPITP